jgi:hypothetical protein
LHKYSFDVVYVVIMPFQLLTEVFIGRIIVVTVVNKDVVRELELQLHTIVGGVG